VTIIPSEVFVNACTDIVHYASAAYVFALKHDLFDWVKSFCILELDKAYIPLFEPGSGRNI
jgi:hypothetical protein